MIKKDWNRHFIVSDISENFIKNINWTIDTESKIILIPKNSFQININIPLPI